MSYQSEMADLIVRRNLAKIAVATLETAKDDPRYPEMIVKYRGQLETIEAKIKALEESPHDVVIGLKPAILTQNAQIRR